MEKAAGGEAHVRAAQIWHKKLVGRCVGRMLDQIRLVKVGEKAGLVRARREQYGCGRSIAVLQRQDELYRGHPIPRAFGAGGRNTDSVGV